VNNAELGSRRWGEAVSRPPVSKPPGHQIQTSRSEETTAESTFQDPLYTRRPV